MAQVIETEDTSDAILGLAPFFHSMGFMLMFLNLLRGKKMVVMSRFRPKAFLDAVVKYQVLLSHWCCNKLITTLVITLNSLPGL